MLNDFASPSRKGRLSLSISQEVLDRLEPYKHEINLSAQAEQLFLRLLEQIENREWLQRCAEPLARYGQSIQTSGPAGEEFDRL